MHLEEKIKVAVQSNIYFLTKMFIVFIVFGNTNIKMMPGKCVDVFIKERMVLKLYCVFRNKMFQVTYPDQPIIKK